MRNIRTPGTPEAAKVRLMSMEAKVRSLQAQLKSARAERDALRAEVGRLQSDRDGDAWKQD